MQLIDICKKCELEHLCRYSVRMKKYINALQETLNNLEYKVEPPTIKEINISCTYFKPEKGITRD